MPLMVFLTANSSVFAGNMVRVEGRNPDGEIAEADESNAPLEPGGDTVITEGIDDPASASLCIPLSDDTDVNQIRFAEDPLNGRIDIDIRPAFFHGIKNAILKIIAMSLVSMLSYPLVI